MTIRVGIAGFGRMGAAMATRLHEKGCDLVVWNRSPKPQGMLDAVGATKAASLAELVGASDVILTSLFDEDAVRTVYFGADGLTQANLAGKLVIDTSTMPPRVAMEIGHATGAAGGRFVDAPVLGTVAPAREGRLIALLGGTLGDVAEAAATMALVARAVHPMGPRGAGYAAKLAINLLKGSYWAALGDCLGLARRYDIAPDAILDVIESGPGAIVELANKMPVLRGQKTEPAFDIRGGLKDLEAIIEAAGGDEHALVAAGAKASMARAIAAGWGDRDIAAIALFAASEQEVGDKPA